MIIYPNPANDIINFEFPSQIDLNNIDIKLFSVTGKFVLAKTNTNTQWNISKLKSGSYFLQIKNGKTEFTKAIIKF